MLDINKTNAVGCLFLVVSVVKKTTAIAAAAAVGDGDAMIHALALSSNYTGCRSLFPYRFVIRRYFYESIITNI